MHTLPENDFIKPDKLDDFDLPELEANPLWARSMLAILMIVLLGAAVGLYIAQQLLEIVKACL